MKVTNNVIESTQPHYLSKLNAGQVVFVSAGKNTHWLIIGAGQDSRLMCLETGYISAPLSTRDEFVIGRLLPAGTQITLTTE